MNNTRPISKKKRQHEREELKHVATSFKANPMPKARRVFTPVRASLSRERVRGFAPKLRTTSQSEHRSAFDKRIAQHKKNEVAKKKKKEQELKVKAERELRELRRKSVSKGGYCFEAKPINHVLEQMSLSRNSAGTAVS